MFFINGNKAECFGCEACVQVCAQKAITMVKDDEGFRYPVIDHKKCIKCGLCQKICAWENTPKKKAEKKYVYGGYHLNNDIRFESTSGGAFSSIVEAFCDENYVVFGAEANGLQVFHSFITNIENLSKFRKSKYSQSVIGSAYKDAKAFLQKGKKVLFSGTPCQIAGLISFLGNVNRDNLLTVEVVCEGVPSPLYIQKYEHSLEKEHGSKIQAIDYRYTGKSIFNNGKWDFEIMKISMQNGKEIETERWFNPFWSVWLSHLMSRPSCYQCKFTTAERIADITLGDLWGVHIYCPELYGNNGGASLVIGNSEKGKLLIKKAQKNLFGHELSFEDAIKYQGPLRKPISMNLDRDEFMDDIKSDLSYEDINRKWAKKPTVKLLFQKYIWGNRQKVFVWNLTHR